MLLLSRQLEFSSKREMKAMSVASSSRWLVRSGSMLHLTSPDAKLTFSRKLIRPTKLYFFLFNDMFFIAKRKRYLFIGNECVITIPFRLILISFYSQRRKLYGSGLLCEKFRANGRRYRISNHVVLQEFVDVDHFGKSRSEDYWNGNWSYFNRTMLYADFDDYHHLALHEFLKTF